MKPRRNGKVIIEQLRRNGIDVLEVADEKQLFLDDEYLIADTHDIEFVVGKPEKYERNPVLKPEYPWKSWKSSWSDRGCVPITRKDRIMKNSCPLDQGGAVYASGWTL